MRTLSNGRKMRGAVNLALSLAFLFLNTASAAIADDASAKAGEQIFQSKCAACHTIGKGQLVGPDLAKNKSWTESNLESGIKSMQKTVGPLSDLEISNLRDFLLNPDALLASQAQDGNSSSPAAKNASGKNENSQNSEISQNSANSQKESPDSNEDKNLPQEIMSGSVIAGAELFDGRRAFEKGGMSCIACHSADGSGNTMGPDLKHVAGKMNKSALIMSCQNTPFKVMKAAYAAHPVSKQEALDLVAYFESIDKEASPKKSVSVMTYGTVGSALIIGLIAFALRNRNSGVRKKLQRRH